MTGIGGSVESLTIAGREFHPTADSDCQISLGGFTSAVEANGNKSARKLLTAVPNSVKGLVVEIDDSDGDLEFLQEVANHAYFDVFTITLVSGKTYQGKSTVVGDLAMGTASASAPVEFSGPGQLTLQ